MFTAILRLVAFEWFRLKTEDHGVGTGDHEVKTGNQGSWTQMCGSNINISLRALEKIESDSVTVNSSLYCEMLALIYEKKVFADHYEPEVRRELCRSIFDPSQRTADFEGIFQRLRRLTSAADLINESDTVPLDVMSWGESMRLLPPEWSDPRKSFVFHRDDPDVAEHNKEKLLLQRVQDKSLCHMHAPAVMQHYLISKYSRDKIQPAILDMAQYVREALCDPHFQDYVLRGEGTSSRTVLKRLLEPLSELKLVKYREIDAAMLSAYGPALLNGFAVCDDFGAEEGRLVYDLAQCNRSLPNTGPVYVGCEHVDTGEELLLYAGAEFGRCTEFNYHAMLIVGVRTQGATRRFLVQNWWRRLQFLEISADYLETQPYANIGALFVLTPQRAPPMRWTRPAARYAETTLIDTLEPEPVARSSR